MKILNKFGNIKDYLRTKWYFQKNVHNLQPVPSYFYHQIEAEEFTLICQKIISKNFITITFKDLLDNIPKPESSLLLTMDDGWSSVWSIAFPIARRYGIRFTLFIVPQAIEDSRECRPTLDDGIDGETLSKRDRTSRCMLTWGEVRAMHESGIVDIQSHSLHHGVVFSSNNLCGYTTPEGPFPRRDRVPLVSRLQNRDIARWQLPLGTPLYQIAPALAASKRFIEDEHTTEKCVALVKEKDNFFSTQAWQDILQKNLEQEKPGRWETKEERRYRFYQDLQQAKTIIETKIPNIKVRAFAPPWGKIHDDLYSIAEATGHEIIVLTYPLPNSIPETSSIPIYPRFKGDTIWFLLEEPLRGCIEFLKANRRAIARQKIGANP